MSKLLIDCKLRNDCTWAPCAFKRRRRKNSWGSGPGLLVSNLTVHPLCMQQHSAPPKLSSDAPTFANSVGYQKLRRPSSSSRLLLSRLVTGQQQRGSGSGNTVFL
eukprot:scaffold59976_cov18-Tisochrysis_lutea.AAC.2